MGYINTNRLKERWTKAAEDKADLFDFYHDVFDSLLDRIDELQEPVEDAEFTVIGE